MFNKSEILGQMRDRVAIQTVTESQGLSGGITESWATSDTVWCKVEYQSTGSDEKEATSRKTAYGSIKFTMHFYTGLSEKNRLVYEGDNYDITRIEVSADKFFHIVEAEKRV